MDELLERVWNHPWLQLNMGEIRRLLKSMRKELQAQPESERDPRVTRLLEMEKGPLTEEEVFKLISDWDEMSLLYQRALEQTLRKIRQGPISPRPRSS